MKSVLFGATRAQRGRSASIAVVVAVLVAFSTSSIRSASAALSDVGRWTNLFEIDGQPGLTNWTGVHTVLARGNGDTTAILHFQTDWRSIIRRVPNWS